MEGITRTVAERRRKEMTQKELDDFLCYCEEFFWIDHFDKLIIKEKKFFE
ncbi:MAG: hypothetical protein ACFFG0_31725 [Candidatus Thorarchaeota archaeon]